MPDKVKEILKKPNIPALGREILPIPDIPPIGVTTYDACDPDTKFPPIVPLRPPPGAPNMLVILLDDVGFGASSAFGGPCATPIFEELAANGLKYTRFHTTALCAPNRAALLSGRNHHSVGFGNITETATSAPGQNCLRPNSKATIQESCDSTAMPPRSSANATRSQCGRAAQPVLSIVGPPERVSNTSMVSSAARQTNGIQLCMRSRRDLEDGQRPSRNARSVTYL
jgi:hypothetical protein